MSIPDFTLPPTEAEITYKKKVEAIKEVGRLDTRKSIVPDGLQQYKDYKLNREV